jgi:hypothetical protein
MVMNSSDFPWIPQAPEVSAELRGEAESELRYQDLCQDGRLRIAGVWPPMGQILWTRMQLARSLGRLARQGIRNVMSYVAMASEDVPLSIFAPAHSAVKVELGHTRDESGAPNRVILNTWLETDALRARRNHPASRPSDQRVHAARAFGQHVFTRPAAPRGQHRVTRLEDPELGGLVQREVTFVDPKSLLALPAGAEPIDSAPVVDVAPVVFGLVHTDGNQHVNFLIYPRLVEDALLRRLPELGVDARRLGRSVEVGYKRPCFAGDRMNLLMQVFRLEAAVGVVAAVVPAEDAQRAAAARDFSAVERLHCAVRLVTTA